MTGAPLAGALLKKMRGGNRLCRERPKNLLDRREGSALSNRAASAAHMKALREGALPVWAADRRKPWLRGLCA